MQKKKIEYLQYKLNYEENKKKWDLKIAVQAGDAQDRMKELIEIQTKNEDYIKELETQNSRLSKENVIYKDYLVKEQYKFSFDKLQDMIKHSENDLIELKKAEKEDQQI